MQPTPHLPHPPTTCHPHPAHQSLPQPPSPASPHLPTHSSRTPLQLQLSTLCDENRQLKRCNKQLTKQLRRKEEECESLRVDLSNMSTLCRRKSEELSRLAPFPLPPAPKRTRSVSTGCQCELLDGRAETALRERNQEILLKLEQTQKRLEEEVVENMGHQLYIRELLLAAPWEEGEQEENSTNDCSLSQREEPEHDAEWEQQQEASVYEDFQEEGDGWGQEEIETEEQMTTSGNDSTLQHPQTLHPLEWVQHYLVAAASQVSAFFGSS